MSFTFGRVGIAAAVVTGLLAGSVAVASTATAEGTPTPWAPNGVNADQNAVGGLNFYNAEGTIITSGRTDTPPFAAYVEGRTPTRTTIHDTKATVYLYVPEEGKRPDTWSNNFQLGGSTVFPNTAAPAPVKSSTLPVNTGSDADYRLDEALDTVGGTSPSTGYAGVYQLRMYTSAPQQSRSTTYLYADIKIDTSAHTWTLVFSPGNPPAPPVAAAPTSLAITAASTVAYGAATTLSAKLTNSSSKAAIAGQPVTLYRRATSTAAWVKVGSTVTTNSTGSASVVTKPTANGQYQFRYAASAKYTASTSATKSLTVTQVVSASRSAASVVHGKSVFVYGTVNPAGTGAKVSIQQKSGTSWKTISTPVIKSQKLPNGRTAVGFSAAVKLAAKGTYSYRVVKAATSTLVAGTSVTLSVRAT